MSAQQSREASRRQRTQLKSTTSPTSDDLKRIIRDENATKDLINYADQLGEQLASKNLDLATSQIRALFGEVRRIQAMWPKESELETAADDERILSLRNKARKRLFLLIPKMMYRVGKETGKKKAAVRKLVDNLKPALEAVLEQTNPKEQREYLERFVEYFEAVLAYHRFYGGK